MCCSTLRRSFMCNAVGTTLGLFALASGTIAIVSPDWKNDGDVAISGLWKACFAVTCDTIEGTAWLQTTRVFVVTMVALIVIGILTNILSQCFFSRKFRRCSATFFGVAGISGLIGAAVYMGMTKQKDEIFFYGYGFALAWVAAVLALFADAFNRISEKKMPEEVEVEAL